jgi:hypothetical protein
MIVKVRKKLPALFVVANRNVAVVMEQADTPVEIVTETVSARIVTMDGLFVAVVTEMVRFIALTAMGLVFI